MDLRRNAERASYMGPDLRFSHERTTRLEPATLTVATCVDLSTAYVYVG
jgi:hypothetical protein